MDKFTLNNSVFFTEEVLYDENKISINRTSVTEIKTSVEEIELQIIDLQLQNERQIKELEQIIKQNTEKLKYLKSLLNKE